MVISLMKICRSINLVAVVSIFVATSLRSTVVFGQYASTPPSTTTLASTSSGGSSYTSGWLNAHATFYGDDSARETMGGACGYGNLFDNGYGTATAALSTMLFNNGKVCGSCYQLKCVNSKWCFSGAAPITITATNLCPPNWYQASDNGGWCNPPRTHFDLSKPIFMKFAQWTAGIVPVQYRRVPCQRQGGIRFKFSGNRDWLLVSVMNVGGPGDVSQMWVKGTKMSWISMSRNWGASFQAFSRLGGQALCFKLKSATGQIALAYNVAPSSWTVGQTYQATVNLR